ncbi:MAG TPA: hypothetical protein VIO81_15710 [Methyloversatilis sp.]
MKVTASNIQLDASHTESRRLDVTERLDMWIGDRRAPGGSPQSDAVTLSDEARAAQQADPIAGTDDGVRNDPRLSLLIMLIEKITGRPVRWLQASDLQAPPAAMPVATDAPQRAGYGMEYDYRAEYSESESTTFTAEGTVRTADGRDIRFTLETSLSRSFSTRESASFRAGDAVLKDPLMLDFAGPTAHLSDLRFAFDLDADGTKEQVPLPGGRGMLAFDRNDNGRIDDGRELFGPTTGRGFDELAALDADGNGWLDEADPAFAHLRLWRPDASGVGTLQTMKDASAGAFWLGRVDTPFSLRGADNEVLGQMRASSVYVREDGSAGTLSQVDLSV